MKKLSCLFSAVLLCTVLSFPSFVYAGTDSIVAYNTNSHAYTTSSENMGGEYYKNGTYFSNLYEGTSEARYNLSGKYDYIEFYYGSGRYSSSGDSSRKRVMSFYGDGELLKTVTVHGGDLPKKIKLDVEGVEQFDIIAEHCYEGGVDIAVADMQGHKKSSVSESKDRTYSQDYISAYSTDHSYTSSTIMMGGDTYKSAVNFSNSDADGEAHYNLSGKYDYVKFYYGANQYCRADKTVSKDIYFYGDGKLLKSVTLHGGDKPKQLKLEVEGVDQLDIVAEYCSGRDGIMSISVAEMQGFTNSSSSRNSETTTSSKASTSTSSSKKTTTSSKASTSSKKATTSSKASTSSKKTTTSSKASTSSKKATTSSKASTSSKKATTSSKASTSSKKATTSSKASTSSKKATTSSKASTSSKKATTSSKASTSSKKSSSKGTTTKKATSSGTTKNKNKTTSSKAMVIK